jgi:hypothetical protein
MTKNVLDKKYLASEVVFSCINKADGEGIIFKNPACIKPVKTFEAWQLFIAPLPRHYARSTLGDPQ